MKRSRAQTAFNDGRERGASPRFARSAGCALMELSASPLVAPAHLLNASIVSLGDPLLVAPVLRRLRRSLASLLRPLEMSVRAKMSWRFELVWMVLLPSCSAASSCNSRLADCSCASNC